MYIYIYIYICIYICMCVCEYVYTCCVHPRLHMLVYEGVLHACAACMHHAHACPETSPATASPPFPTALLRAWLP